MKIFDTYALYYDLLYKDKDYAGEVNYVEKFIKQYNPGAEKILDLGCGTGKHDFILAEKGFGVTGLEMSENMINTANENLKLKKNNSSGLQFIRGDIRQTELEEKFDVVLALFHVFSYQTSNSDTVQTLKNVRQHLKPDGLFIFDFWYGPAVLTERPEPRMKKLENEVIKIERFADPHLHINENIVDVKYLVKITEKKTGTVREINETHKMRYFFIPEINLLLDEYDMKAIHFEEWMTSEELSDKSWSALGIAKNK